ncbi:MAG: hypothetical protein E7336_00170 [Clostridiales bacterium]|nr:hypothetical protein [Clostridiales bacterium]
MKKLVALFLALCLLPVVALGELSAPGVYPISDEKLDLTIWCTSHASVPDYYTNKMVTTYEEMSNVHVTWELAGTDAATSYNLSITGGESSWPDIYLNNVNSANGGDLLTLAADGVIIPLNDLIENETVYIKAYLEEHPEIKEAITAPDGNIYSLFTSMYQATEDMMLKMWVYEEWLEAYKAATGKGMPATTEEFKDMLIYFRDNDMNGNGDTTDEIPLTGTYAYWADGSDPMHYLIGAFQKINTIDQAFFHKEGDEYVFEAASDTYREGLKYVRSLVEEGLLAEDTYVQDLSQFRALTSTTKDKVIVGCAAAPYCGRLLTRNTEVENFVDYSSYVLVPPLTGPDGFCGTPLRTQDRIIFRGFITTACEDPVLAIKWLDYWYSKDGQDWTNYEGPEGVGYEWVDKVAIDGSARSINNWDDPDNSHLPMSYGVPFIQTRDTFLKQALENVYNSASTTVEYIKQPYLDVAYPTGCLTVVWCQDLDLVAERAELKTLFNDYIMNSATEFVLGVRDIHDDAQWEAYLAELDNMGLERYIEVINTYYLGE